MTTLTDFLLARITEDKAVARAAISNQGDEGWEASGPSRIAPVFTNSIVLSPHVGIIHEAVQIEHIVRWAPWRVLAECEAKRRIVEDWQQGAEVLGEDGQPLAWTFAPHHALIDLTARWLRYLALPYADHPDFDPAWAV